MEAAAKLFARLNEVEKIALRLATPGRIEYLAGAAYNVDFFEVPHADRVAILGETQALAHLEFAAKGEHPTFGQTWLY